MKKSFDFTITDELRQDYEKFLKGQTTYDDVKKKYNISLYQLTKLFDIMYHEKINNNGVLQMVNR